MPELMPRRHKGPVGNHANQKQCNESFLFLHRELLMARSWQIFHTLSAYGKFTIPYQSSTAYSLCFLSISRSSDSTSWGFL
jgi:hypothetical protein